MPSIRANIVRPASHILTRLQNCQDTAAEMYEEPVCFDVSYLFGNYSGYGAYLSRYNAAARLIEIPTNPSFEMLTIQGNELLLIGNRTVCRLYLA